MNSSVLEQIEDMIEFLSSEEQLQLIEQLAHRLRKEPAKSDDPTQLTFESQLAAMAADPEVQAGLREINCEFNDKEKFSEEL